MERTNFNMYLFKALEAYPYELEKAVEALNYTLSYDQKNAVALFLMARIYSEQLGDYETAKAYFAEALANDMDCAHIYPYYLYTLLLNEDYEESKKLLDYALTIKATDKAVLYMYQGFLNEKLGNYKEALEAMKVARKKTISEDLDAYLERQITRIKKKLPKKVDTDKNAANTKKTARTSILKRLNIL